MRGRIFLVGLGVIAAVMGGLIAWDATLLPISESPQQECLAVARYAVVSARTQHVKPVLDADVARRAGQASDTGSIDCTRIFKIAGLFVDAKPCAPDVLCTSYDLAFSRVAPRSTSATEAEVYVDHLCAPDCGYGSKLGLKRVATVWWVVAEEMTWIS